MNFRTATQEDVNRIEHQVDLVYQATPLPQNSRELARWYLLTVAEDKLRLLLAHSHEDSLESKLRIYHHMNDLKYSTKEALRLLDSKTEIETTASIPLSIDGEAYTRAAELLSSSSHYQSVIAAIGSYLNKRSEARIEEDGLILKIIPKPGSDRYDCLELIESTTMPESRDPVRSLLSWIRIDENLLPGNITKIHTIGKALGDEGIDYTFDDALANELSKHLGSHEPFIPQNFTSKLGTTTQLRSVLRALQVVCAYHFLAVFLNARRINMSGLGASTALLVLQKVEFVNRLCLVSAQPHHIVDEIVDFLTYGSKVRTPDPALQPLVSIRAGELATCPLLTLSSHLERNFLALLARAHKTEFDAASHVFESEMIPKINGTLNKMGAVTRTAFYVPGAGQHVGEIDLIAVDSGTGTIVVFELKWTIPPADTREVLNREEEAIYKANQVRRKRAAVEQQLPIILHALGLSEQPPKRWRVKGCVIVDGFCAETTIDVPVVSFRTFERGSTRVKSLGALLKWLSSPDKWLPRRPAHFERIRAQHRFGGVSVEWGGIIPKEDGYRFVHLSGH